MTETCHGHSIPPFREVLVKLLRAGLASMSAEQVQALQAALPATDRVVLGGFLGVAGAALVREGLESAKAALVATWPTESATGEEAFRTACPRLVALVNNRLQPAQLDEVLSALAPEDLASQSFFLGTAGRRALFGALDPERAVRVLDHTADWVLIESARRTHAELTSYTSTFRKRERLDGKMNAEDTIALKARESPRALYLKWIEGPHRGREALYNTAVLGDGKVRVREAGLLGVLAVTLGVDSPLARMGTTHPITDLGLQQLLKMIETDFRKALPHGHVVRKNHGLVTRAGRRLYRIESILPRDPSLGYYAHRVFHYTDYLESLEVGAEVHGFDDQLKEAFFYEDLRFGPALADAEFDPRNPSYRLK